MSLLKRNLAIKITNTQPTFIFSKSTTETPGYYNNIKTTKLRLINDLNGLHFGISDGKNCLKLIFKVFIHVSTRLLLQV